MEFGGLNFSVGHEMCQVSVGTASTVSVVWGTVPRVGNVAQPPLGIASGEQGWRAGPRPMDRFSCGQSGLHCTSAAMILAFAKIPST